jgi:single-stranded-DNA-specific exonuclease
MSKYQRPTAILSPYESEEGLKWEGSARGYDKSQLKDFRAFCEDSNLVYLAQGHANAFGLGILDSNFEVFMEYAEKELENIEFEPLYRVDYIFSANDFNSAMILDIASLKPWWGQDIDEAYVAIEGIKVTRDNLYLMSRDKNPTLKINLPNGVSCIKFKSSEEEFNKLFSESGCVVINVVGKCEANVWNDMVTP